MTSTPDPNKATPANSNDTHWLEIGVVEDRFRPGHWLVETVDHQSEGEIYRATFDGPDAEKRARAYAETLKPSAAVEAEVAELVALLREHVRYEYMPARCREAMDDAADLLTRLASEKARLEAQDARSLAEINLWAERQKEVGDLYAAKRARAERAEAERDAATKRAEAAETALKELHAMVWGEAPHLLDEDRAGNARLDLEIEAILNRPHGLTGEGAERARCPSCNRTSLPHARGCPLAPATLEQKEGER